MSACSSSSCGKDVASATCPPCSGETDQAELLKKFLEDNRGRYRAAISRARRWLDGLAVDPLELRKVGIKGKKKLVEILDAYVRLYRTARAEDREPLMNRIKEVAAATYNPAYHDLQNVDDKVFKEDATSYLRAAYLLDRLGLETKLYQAEIRKVHGRLNRHMPERGPHQQMVFQWYYQHFGLEEPFPLGDGFRKGIVASRLGPYGFKDTDAYGLTHEVFVPYRFGEKLDADFFSADEKKYLRWSLERLAVFYTMAKNPDLVAELISTLRFLRFTDLSVYREAVDFLLSAQHPDGKWGLYEKQRAKLGDYVNQGLYLHTTMVAVDALTFAFEPE